MQTFSQQMNNKTKGIIIKQTHEYNCAQSGMSLFLMLNEVMIRFTCAYQTTPSI